MNTRRLRPWLALTAVLAASAVVYWPGTHGSFLLDDLPNIVQNPALRSFTPNTTGLLRAAFSMNSGPLGRPIAMASFALNVAATGMTPGPMKITNVAIHLFNGLLVFVLMGLILSEYRRLRPDVPAAACTWAALAITAAWLLAPINLTAVLYIVQRMTSLAATFTLAGLIAYVAGRRRLYDGERVRSGLLLMGAAALVLTPLAILVKEIGALTLLYALVIEWVFFGFRNASGKRSRTVLAYFLVFLVLPAAAGWLWLLPRVLGPAAYAARPYDLGERVLTEGRVLWHYLYWTLVPNIGALSLYHDAFPVSRGLLIPWTSLPAWLGIGLLGGAGITLRRRFPLVAFGILWFLAGQALTATVIPLELVFEHRMYLPAIGLFTALFGELLLASSRERLVRLRGIAAVLLIVLYGSALALRSYDWSNPLIQMSIAAREHPDSPRATYGYGRVLAMLSTDVPALVSPAFSALEAASKVPGQSITPESALIILASRVHRQISDAWYQSMIAKLERRPPTAEDISALYALIHCATQAHDRCALDPKWMTLVFATALTHRHTNPAVTAMYGNYLLTVADNPAQAEKTFSALVAGYPSEPVYRYDLGVAAAYAGDLDTARRELGALKRLNRLNMHAGEVTTLEHLIQKMAAGGNAHGN